VNPEKGFYRVIIFLKRPQQRDRFFFVWYLYWYTSSEWYSFCFGIVSIWNILKGVFLLILLHGFGVIMKKRLFFRGVWVCLGLAVQSFGAQYAGQVLDKGTELPIEGVRVQVSGSDEETVTDGNGLFSLEVTSGIISEDQGRGADFFWSASSQQFSGEGSVNIFALNGSQIIPDVQNPLQTGVYILRLEGEDSKNSLGQVWNYQGKDEVFSTGIESGNLLRKKAQTANSKGGVQLIFSHDSYYSEDHTYDEASSDILEKLEADETPWIFDESVIREYHLNISSADSVSMYANALQEEYIDASLEVDGEAIGDVGLRFKGSDYSLNVCFDENGLIQPIYNDRCRKVSLKIKAGHQDSTLRLKSLKKLDLLGLYPNSMFNNKLSYSLMKDMGIPCPRTAYAKVYVNGRYWGIYLATENVDGRFTKHHFGPDGNGNVYKEIWPNGQPEEHYAWAMTTNENDGVYPDVSWMMELNERIMASNENSFEQMMEGVLDVDHLVRYRVVDQAINNWDGMLTWYEPLGGHNFYWADRGNGTPFMLIPWDLDNTFNDWGNFGTPAWNTRPADCLNSMGRYAPGCDKLIGLLARTQWDSFVEYGEEFLENYFQAHLTGAKIRDWAEFIDAAVVQDPNVDYEYYEWDMGDLMDDRIPDYISRFRNHLSSGYSEESERSSLNNALTSYTGLSLEDNNSFEISGLSGTQWYALDFSENASGTVSLNDSDVVYGKKDIRFDYTLNPEGSDFSVENPQSARAGFTLYFENGSVDLSDVDEISIMLHLSRMKNLRVELMSDVYESYSELGAIPLGFRLGWEELVNTRRTLELDLSDLSFGPDAPAGLPDLEDDVLSSVSGLRFIVGPEVRWGQVLLPEENGFVQVDNISFY
jgi:spore coat protein CotH